MTKREPIITRRELHVVLIETASRGQRGSMVRYADQVAHVLCRLNYPFQVRIRRVCLAPPISLLKFLPVLLRARIHHVWVAWASMVRLAGQQADIFHIIDGSQAYVAKWLPDTPVLATAHDFIPLLQSNGRFPQKPLGRIARWLIHKSIEELKKLELVIADSQSTKNDFVNSAGGDIDKIMVVYPAVSTCMSKGTVSKVNTQWTDRRHSKTAFILHVGNNSFYKNRAGVLRVFARIRKKFDVELKMAGQPPGPELISLIRELDLTSSVPSPNLPVHLKPLLQKHGFYKIKVDPIPILNTEYSPSNFSHGMLKWISKNAENKGVINKVQRSNWLEDLQNRGQSDSFFFCVNRFLFTGYL
mgnify:CR=1 FL=1